MSRCANRGLSIVGRAGAGLLLYCCTLGAVLAADAADGRWRLIISGHQTFVYGDQILAGGLRVPWETVIDFKVAGGRYQLGQGRARWLGEVQPYSQPPGWFHCELTEGTYLDRSLHLQETPWVRYQAFPVAGAIDNGNVVLRADLEPPGNYLALTYRCESDNPAAVEWFPFASRGRQEQGRRQDAVRQTDGDHRSVAIREVGPLPPAGTLTLPLREGWFLRVGADDELDSVTYRLERRE
jgi:hypothetical protein